MISSAAIFNAHILIVDDLEAKVSLLKRMVGAAGYLFLESTMNPFEACRLYGEHRYDIVLLDIMMPGMDGFQVLEGLKEMEPDGNLPVLVITAQPGHKLRALQAGAKDVISKPFECAAVLARVRNILEGHLLQKELEGNSDLLDLRVRQRTADLHEGYLETIFAMTRAAELKDIDTGTHVQRISYYCSARAKMLGMDEEFVS